MTDVITMSSSSDDDRPPIARGGEASSSSSDGDAGFNGDVLATELAKMPLALRAQLTAAAKSSTSTNQRTLVSEWSEKTKLSVDLVEKIFASFAKSSRASAEAARETVARLAAADGVDSADGDEYSPGAAEAATADDDAMDDSPKIPASKQPVLEEGVPFPGITRDVSVDVACGDLRGVLELKKGYKKLQERVRCEGEMMTPSKFESEGGRGSAKKWKISLRIVRSDGKLGMTVGDWIDRYGYHPSGLVIGGEVADAPAPPKVKKSAFESQLETLLDYDGDIALRSIAKFVRMMRETTKPKERGLLLQVIRGTKNKECLRQFGQSAEIKGLDTLQDWMDDAKRKFQSTLLVSILRTLKMIPVTLDALTRTSIAPNLGKLKSYVVPEGEEEFANTEMNTKVVLLSKSVKNAWKAQITAPHTAPAPAPKLAPVVNPAPAAVPASKAVELGDDDLFGAKSKISPAPSKAPVVKTTVTKITMEKKVAPPSVTTKKPSVSVNDLLKTSSQSTKITAPPVKTKEKAKDDDKIDEKTGKKRKRKTVTWAKDENLEQVRIFEKDAKQPKEAAFPDPTRDGGTDGASRKALERRDREVEAERKAAAKQHQRRLDEMRATTTWRPPRRIEIPRWEEEESDRVPGDESEESQRILRIEAEKPSVKYRSLKDIPDSPAEAPNEDAQLDLDNTPAFYMKFQEEPLSQDSGEPSPAMPQQLQMPQAPGSLLPPNIDFAALQRTLLAANAPHQNAGYQYPPQAPLQHAFPPPPPQAAYAPQPPYQPGAQQPAQRPTKQALVGGAPVPAQQALNLNGKTYRGVCAFFNTPRGCSWGDKCGYLHQVGVNPPSTG